MKVTVSAVSVLLAIQCLPSAMGEVRGVPKRNNYNQGRRVLKNDGKDGGSGNVADSLEETRPCVPFSELKDSVLNHYNTQSECTVENSCSGGCCRIYDWMVCDTNNYQPSMACVCNANTNTYPPTSSPTTTPSPTVSPTDTKAPSSSPTKAPTTSPTEPQPTASPTTSPPTTSPTQSPTTAPSASPSVSPFITQESTDEQGKPVRTTVCQIAPPSTSSLRRATFSYQYQVYPSQQGLTTLDDTVVSALTEYVHDAIVAEFFDCTATDEDYLFVLQSSPHAVNSSASCYGDGADNCFVVFASQSVTIYDAPDERRVLEDGFFQTWIDTLMEYLLGQMDGTDDELPATLSSVISKVLLIESGDLDMVTSEPLPTDAPVASPTSAPTATAASPTSVGSATSGNAALVNDDPNNAWKYIVAIMGVAMAVVGAILFVRSKERDDNSRELTTDKSFATDIVTSPRTEAHLDLDSSYGGDGVEVLNDEGQWDPFTSATPTNRNKRGPLFVQDEHNQGASWVESQNSQGQPVSPNGHRSYFMKDTVHL
eukprot:Nitzschia sp. Nitz4//scaffold148_size54725//42454//44073//NITZ4_006666-RA/size54725-processed-gene-0.17-mRNA-1//1//CDS//3329536772//5825//frame0